MSFAKTLEQVVPQGHSQKALAMMWLGHWGRQFPRAAQPSPATVESRLSEALANKGQGVRFLFKNEQRTSTTFAAFEVKQEQRTELLRHAQPFLDVGHEALRLIVDLTSGPAEPADDVEAMFASFRERFLGEHAVWPMALVLTSAQYERLPRSFDEFGNLKALNFGDATDAGARIAALAEEGTFVAARAPRGPFERWIALEIDDALRMEPADALKTILEGGELPRLPVVTRPLARLVKPDGSRLPECGAIARRQLMLDLANGQAVRAAEDSFRWGYRDEAKPEQRVAWAEQLGVEAAATPHEWAASLPARIAPAPILRHVPAADLEWIARYVAVASTAAKTSAGLLIVNPTDDVRRAIEGEASIEQRSVSPDLREKLDELMSHARRFTIDDVEDDPYLEELLAYGTSLEIDPRMLELAHDALMRAESFPAAAIKPLNDVERIGEWLRDVTQEAAPAALRLRRNDGPLLVPERLESQVAASTEIVVGRHPRTSVRVLRGDTLREVAAPTSDTDTWPVARLGRDATAWSNGLLEPLRRRLMKDEALPARLAHDELESNVVLPDAIWTLADRQLFFVFLALRDALRIKPLHALPNGRIMLDLAGGVFAELRVREHARADTLQADLELSYQRRAHSSEIQWLPLDSLVPVFEAQSEGYGHAVTQIGPMLPARITLSARGLRADIRFVGSGLHARTTLTEAAVAANAHASDMDQERRDDEDARRHDDDDD
jgi:hypothetical protein